jgi:hypothetical protein
MLNKIIVSLFFLISSQLFAENFELTGHAIQKTSTLKDVRLFYRDDFFVISRDNKEITIPSYSLDDFLRKLKNESLKAFLEENYVSIHEHSGTYTLKSNVRGKGGGLLFGLTSGAITLAVGTALTLSATTALLVRGKSSEARIIFSKGLELTSKATAAVTAVGTTMPTV